jgi:hypothetical protein
MKKLNNVKAVMRRTLPKNAVLTPKKPEHGTRALRFGPIYSQTYSEGPRCAVAFLHCGPVAVSDYHLPAQLVAVLDRGADSWRVTWELRRVPNSSGDRHRGLPDGMPEFLSALARKMEDLIK